MDRSNDNAATMFNSAMIYYSQHVFKHFQDNLFCEFLALKQIDFIRINELLAHCHAERYP